MSETFMCGRRSDPFSWQPAESADKWFSDGTCSYCGSLNEEEFMRRCEAGDVQLVPTDKDYKVYLRNMGGANFKMAFRACPIGTECSGPDACTHWTTEDRDEAKFYFQHLHAEQKHRFIALLNEKRLSLAYPGHFYRLPFFCAPVARTTEV